MRERDIQRGIIEMLEERRRRGEQVYWLNIGGGPRIRKGTPDLLVVYRGVPFLLEIKVPGKKPTRLQRRELEQWNRAGAVTVVVTSVEQAGKQFPAEPGRRPEVAAVSRGDA